MRRTLPWTALIAAVLIPCLTFFEGDVLAKKRKKRGKARTTTAKAIVQIPPLILSPYNVATVSNAITSGDSKSAFIVNEFGVGAGRSRNGVGKARSVGPNIVAPPPSAIISELRLRGPAGAEDEFIEIYNNSSVAAVVQATDGSSGWTIALSNGQIAGPLCTIPNGTVIPARGHLLCANSNGYSLSGYPSGNPNVTTTAPDGATINFVASPFAPTTPDRTYNFDVPDGSGIALFSTTNGPNFTAATRLDAFGFTNSPALYKEGNGFPVAVTANLEHTYFRDLKGSIPKDTNDNAADFRLVGTSANIQINLNGAPGPENLASPIVNNSLGFSLLDTGVSSAAPPNRERRPNFEPNANLGTLLIRRTVTNNTGSPVSRLRFRVIDITTRGTTINSCGGPCADLRLLTSQDGESSVGAQVVSVRGLRLEEPPVQPDGGGFNATASADFITLGTPLAPGQSVNIVFKLGVMQVGAFRFYINIEMLNGSVAVP